MTDAVKNRRRRRDNCPNSSEYKALQPSHRKKNVASQNEGFACQPCGEGSDRVVPCNMSMDDLDLPSLGELSYLGTAENVRSVSILVARMFSKLIPGNNWPTGDLGLIATNIA